MKLTRYIIIIFLGLLQGVCIQLNSQVTCNNSTRCGEIAFEKRLFGKEYINQYTGNQTQFFGDWQYGVIYLTDGSVIKDVYLRYNCYLDEVIWMRIPGYETAILNKEQVQKFILQNKSNNDTLCFVKANIAKWQPTGKEEVYLEKVVAGAVSLYVYRRVLMKFQDYNMYPSYLYFVKIDDELYRIYLNRVSIKTLLRDDKNTIKRAMRGVFSLKIREDDLVKIILRYNGLVEGEL